MATLNFPTLVEVQCIYCTAHTPVSLSMYPYLYKSLCTQCTQMLFVDAHVLCYVATHAFDMYAYLNKINVWVCVRWCLSYLYIYVVYTIYNLYTSQYITLYCYMHYYYLLSPIGILYLNGYIPCTVYLPFSVCESVCVPYS